MNEVNLSNIFMSSSTWQSGNTGIQANDKKLTFGWRAREVQKRRNQDTAAVCHQPLLSAQNCSYETVFNGKNASSYCKPIFPLVEKPDDALRA